MQSYVLYKPPLYKPPLYIAQNIVEVRVFETSIFKNRQSGPFSQIQPHKGMHFHMYIEGLATSGD